MNALFPSCFIVESCLGKGGGVGIENLQVVTTNVIKSFHKVVEHSISLSTNPHHS